MFKKAKEMNFSSTLDFKPALFSDLRGYNFRKFKTDLIAGVVVGIVALPLAIAFGIASGVSPTVGLLTAIIGGFLVSALGAVRPGRSAVPQLPLL